eukprot:CAMPEP_0197619332 /NCGR_PEP_ID=MMETSP1338-20131121/370_1 /TAXON_ID=43686 ORGANISM="Pelagodinium beii, Strain RCC1491" /NCGR_SAMPLE_ID=MMETSP1338 /ASSEMBLY_ACC=CAM_ASM_000754 /LENGTH=128 /DNA_ID=CAMNT_0043188279 /DNA_START=66 /DNA_END=452 /DNA_ORIENTATION=-
MAFRGRSSVAPVVVLAACFALLNMLPMAFVPQPSVQSRIADRLELNEATSAAIAAATTFAAQPVFAASFDDEPDEEEGFDFRLIATLALPGFAVFWAGFNVWRVLFRQTGRQMESAQGSAKPGLRAED